MNQPSRAEFVALAAMLMSLVALSIDTMLPALPDIAGEFQLDDPNDQQYVITVLFLGLGVGQLVYGPLSDAIGRKWPIYIGLGLFSVGGLLCLFTKQFHWLLVGRLLQGLGASSARIVTLAVVRDRFEGAAMAQIMSFIMAIFILVPAMAPLLGQSLLLLGDWHLIFIAILVYGWVAVIWFGVRLPETHPPAKRHPLRINILLRNIGFILRQPVSVGAILVMGMVFGGFVGYLSTAQPIFVEVYHTGTRFPLYFALLAMAIGLASVVNARVVPRLGAVKVCLAALTGQCLWSALMLLLFVLVYQHQPPLWLFMLYCFPLFFFVGLQFGNLNALALQPLGGIAGLGASVAGALSTTLAVPTGSLVGEAYNGTPVPLTLGFLIFGVLGLVIFFTLCRHAEPHTHHAH
ncbi:MAG: multidrug effflux MFS transporter [Pseudomonadota bacterium]|nr:multidrug effflux MFS transporter [Pseudomonadota bacterium]